MERKERQEVEVGSPGENGRVAIVNGVVRAGLPDLVNFEGT